MRLCRVALLSACLTSGLACGGSPPPPPAPRVVPELPLACGSHHTCAVGRTGDVYCWGRNADGQLGRDEPELDPQARAVTGMPDAVALAAGEAFTCAMRAGGVVACWGAPPVAPVQQRNAPLQQRASAPRAVGIRDARALVAGDAHACVLRTNGRVACWGENSAEQLGTEPFEARAEPSDVPGLEHVRELCAAGTRTCALTEARAVVCWGEGAPASLIEGLRAEHLACGPDMVCVITPEGAAQCTGPGAFDVSALRGATQLVAREARVCARFEAGRVQCVDRDGASWQAGALSASTLSIGAAHACARTGDGAVWCWGDNADGQTGGAALTAQPDPARVAGP